MSILKYSGMNSYSGLTLVTFSDVYAHSFAYMLNTICSTSSWQIDPSEKLDPSVEDALVEVAEDFIESVSSSTYTIRSHELVFFFQLRHNI